MLKPDTTVLFQGDSITDAGRRDDERGLGQGYVKMAADTLFALFPDYNLTVLNRGISGNRVLDLEARWDEDCIKINPDILFIFIGINDTWRRYDSGTPLAQQDFEDCYRRILQRVKNETKTREIILIEPFLLPVKPGQETWCEDLSFKQYSVRKLSGEFGTGYIALDGRFAEASSKIPKSDFAADGVHPTKKGARLIAREVLKILCADRTL